jgi:hypothetical protein
MTSSSPPHSRTSSMWGLSAFILPSSEGAPSRSQSMRAGSSDSHQTSSSSRKGSVSHQGGTARQRHSHNTAVRPYTAIHASGSGSFHCNAANEKKIRLKTIAIQRIGCLYVKLSTAPIGADWRFQCKGAIFLTILNNSRLIKSRVNLLQKCFLPTNQSWFLMSLFRLNKRCLSLDGDGLRAVTTYSRFRSSNVGIRA